jgi:hypothetical protein
MEQPAGVIQLHDVQTVGTDGYIAVDGNGERYRMTVDKFGDAGS